MHAAALKQVPATEYNPTEAIKTNIIGTQNVIDAAIDAGVGKVLLVSSDKAVQPINLYGATKLAAEKLSVAANAYSGGGGDGNKRHPLRQRHRQPRQLHRASPDAACERRHHAHAREDDPLLDHYRARYGYRAPEPSGHEGRRDIRAENEKICRYGMSSGS